MIYTCGPEIMMQKVIELSDEYGADCEVSMERYMKCGFGLCGQCCVDGQGLRVCKEGPVFDKEIVKNAKEFNRYHRDATGKKIKFVKEARVFHPPIRRALSSPLKDLLCVRSDVLLFKKFPRQYTKRFGFLCRGFFKLSGFAWLALAFAAWSVYSGLYFLVLLALAAVFAVKLVAERKGRECSAKEGLAFVFFSYIRDLAFPLFFAWNWARVRP